MRISGTKTLSLAKFYSDLAFRLHQSTHPNRNPDSSAKKYCKGRASFVATRSSTRETSKCFRIAIPYLEFRA